MKKIESIFGTLFIGHKSKEISGEGIIYVPWLCVSRPENAEPTADDISYNDFMNKYHKAHEICPVCGSNAYSSTLMGYIFDRSNPDDYKDLNICTCVVCDDRKRMHERISIEEFNIINI